MRTKKKKNNRFCVLVPVLVPARVFRLIVLLVLWYKTRLEAVLYGVSSLAYLIGVRRFELPTPTTPL